MVVASPITGAAIIGGELIISLPNGQIINCGLVQGPPGLKGEPGAPGPTGRPGLDGNTLLHGQGFPALDIGRDGDFYWMTGPDLAVFGPKISGRWGSPVYLKQPIVGVNADAVPMAMAGGEGGGGSSDGPSKVYTNQVIAAGTGRSGKLKQTKAGVSYGGSPNGIIPPSPELKVQSNINNWIVSCIERFDAVVPVAVADSLPATGEYEGDLVLFEGALYIWAEGDWVKVSADGGAHIGAVPPMPAEEGQLWFNNSEDELTLYIYVDDESGWVPAAPPVSLDGINTTITGIEGDLIELHNNVRQVRGDIVLTNQELEILKTETGKLNLPNVWTKSNVWQDDQDQRLFVVQEGGIGGQNSPRVMYYGMTIDSFDIVNKQTMDKAIQRANNEQNTDIDNSINNLQGQVDVLDGRVGANEDALGDLGQKNTDQDEQIEENTQKIDALSRTQAGGVWRFLNTGDTTKADDGTFTLVKSGGSQPVRDWNDAVGMTIASLDQGGVTHDITQWQAGDHVEMYEVGGTSFAIYELKENTQTSRPGQQQFRACLRYAGNPLDRVQYRFKSSTAQLVLILKRPMSAL